jgi:uncharacterized membrane protein
MSGMRVPPTVYVLAVTLVGIPALLASHRLALLCALLFALMVWGSVAAWAVLLTGEALATAFAGLGALAQPSVGLAALALVGLISARLLLDLQDYVTRRSADRAVRPLRPRRRPGSGPRPG